jgi:hypothetical protein
MSAPSSPGGTATADEDEDYVRLQQNGITTSAKKILFEHTLSSVLNDPTVRRPQQLLDNSANLSLL